VIIVIVVTEIISTINAAETHEKLQKASQQMATLQKQSDQSMATLKKAFKSLLTSAKTDIGVYNSVLDSLYKLENNSTYKTSFATKGLESVISAIDAISIDNSGSLAGYQTTCQSDLKPPTDFIRTQSRHDAVMTDVISQIKTHIRTQKLSDVDDDFLEDLADVENIDVALVKKYNAFRKFIAECAAVLLPFHEQVRQATSPGSKTPAVPPNPKFGTPDPKFDPKPGDFVVPSPIKRRSASA
jgi:hypothetical protein